jgi:hypothetical protein
VFEEAAEGAADVQLTAPPKSAGPDAREPDNLPFHPSRVAKRKYPPDLMPAAAN